MRTDTYLKTVAKSLLVLTNDEPAGLLDGGISICEFVSREYGVELTIDEGGRVRKFMNAIKEAEE